MMNRVVKNNGARRVSAGLLALALLLASLGVAAPAYARASILRSDPADGALLTSAPQQIRIWLSETIDSQQVAVTLADSAGRSYPAVAQTALYQPAAAGLANQFDPLYLYLCSLQAASLPSLLIVELPELESGSYQLAWQVAGLRDQRPVSGSLVFALQVGRSGDGATLPLPGARTIEAADLLVNMRVRPNLPGQNFVGLQVASTRRPAPAAISHVRMRLISPDGRQQIVEAESLRSGRWQIAGEQFDQPGEWQVEVTFVRQGLPDVVMRTDWSFPAAQSAQRLGSLPLAGLVALVVVAGLMLLRRGRSLWRVRPIAVISGDSSAQHS
jgi:methionine-rich copper-binding protein CopC